MNCSKTIFVCSIAVFVCFLARISAAAETLPNIVIIFCDDLGYADRRALATTRSRQRTSTNWRPRGHASRRSTSRSGLRRVARAGLLTGCYPNRIGIQGAPGPKSKVGIAASEKLISEICKERGYATALFGKWHLGDHESFCRCSMALTSTTGCRTPTTCGRTIRKGAIGRRCH